MPRALFQLKLTQVQIGHVGHTLIDGAQYFVTGLRDKGELAGACVGYNG